MAARREDLYGSVEGRAGDGYWQVAAPKQNRPSLPSLKGSASCLTINEKLSIAEFLYYALHESGRKAEAKELVDYLEERDARIRRGAASADALHERAEFVERFPDHHHGADFLEGGSSLFPSATHFHLGKVIDTLIEKKMAYSGDGLTTFKDVDRLAAQYRKARLGFMGVFPVCAIVLLPLVFGVGIVKAFALGVLLGTVLVLAPAVVSETKEAEFSINEQILDEEGPAEALKRAWKSVRLSDRFSLKSIRVERLRQVARHLSREDSDSAQRRAEGLFTLLTGGNRRKARAAVKRARGDGKRSESREEPAAALSKPKQGVHSEVKPRPASQQNVAATSASNEPSAQAVSSQGGSRMRRSSYFLAQVGVAVLYMIGVAASEGRNEGLAILMFLGAALLGWVTSVRRFHDMDMSGWWILLGLVPIVNLIVGLGLLFGSGTDGPNQYGPDPRN